MDAIKIGDRDHLYVKQMQEGSPYTYSEFFYWYQLVHLLLNFHLLCSKMSQTFSQNTRRLT